MSAKVVTEDNLKKLMECLVSRFEAEYQSKTYKLSEHIFYVTEDRSGCAKAAGLNYQRQATDQSGQIVQILCSSYSQAVTELVHRGLLSFVDNSNLRFVLTPAGLKSVKDVLEPSKKESFLGKARRFLNENQGPLAAIAIIVSIVGIFVAYWLTKPAA